MLGENAVNYYWAIAILLSAAAGFYYVTYCLQIVSYTNDNNLDTASGIMAMISSFIALTLPLISGFILSSFKGFTGYRILFIFVFFLSALAIIFSTKLSPVNEFDNDKRVHFREVVHALLRNKIGQRVMWITTIVGIREGTFSFFINMLIYQFIANETFVGINSFLGSISAIVSASLYGLLVKPKNRNKSVYLSVTLAGSAIALLYFKLSPATLIAFNIVNSFLGTFIVTPQTNIYFSILQRLDSIRGKGAEVHTVREFFYSTGRVVGIVLTMLMPNSAVGSVTAILLLTASQYISAFLIGNIQKELDNQF
jgi:YQGE family putative transporter